MVENSWNCALQGVNDSTSCERLNVIEFYIEFTFPKRDYLRCSIILTKAVTGVHNTPANLTHMFWSCPAMTTFWFIIFKSLSDALSINFQPKAAAAIFGIKVGEYSISRKSHKRTTAFATLLALQRNFITLEIKVKIRKRSLRILKER